MHTDELLKIGSLSGVALFATYATLYETKSGPRLSSADQLFVSTLAELLKCFLCFCGAKLLARQKSLGYSREYVLFGMLSSYQSFVWLFVAQRLSGVVLQILGHSKTFFVFVLSMLLLRRKYSRAKMVSQLLLFFGLILPCLVMVAQMNPSQVAGSMTTDNFLCSLFTLSACLSGAFSGVLFEKTVKQKVTSKWAGSFNYSVSSFLVSLVSLLAVLAVTSERVAFSWRPLGSLIFFKMVESLICGYVVMRYSSVMKALMVMFSTCVLSIPVSWQFNEAIEPTSVISLAVIVCALVLFNLSK